MFKYWTMQGFVIALILTFFMSAYMHFLHKDAKKNPLHFIITWVCLFLFFGLF